MQVGFRLTVVFLLIGILVVQILILRRMSPPLPTLAVLRQATPEGRKELLLRRPLVTVDGSVSIDGTVGVNIENTPVEVEINR
jgi:hypothetical protein